MSPITGTVISSSRRNAAILLPPDEEVLARTGSKIDSVIVGDRVEVIQEHERYKITAVEARRNCLSRTLGPRTKEIAANLDLVLLVTAVEPLFNTSFVDRVLLVCSLQGIPVQIVLNKCDLGLEDTNYLIETYKAIGVDLIMTSALAEDGMANLLPILEQAELNTLAFAGVSGVGKSSLLNRLVPHAQQRTNAVSRKTGKGTQTTSMAQGYLYGRADRADLLLVDLPGIQNFGVSNLTPRQVTEGYAEFAAIAQFCEYADCQHTAEPNCAVQAGLEQGLISPTRYLSYLGILDEIEAARPY